MLSFLKTKIWPYMIAIAGVVISVIAVIVRRTMKENSRLRRVAENAEVRVNRARVVAQEDIKLIQEEQQREVQIINDLRDGKSDYDPNSLFVHKTDS